MRKSEEVMEGERGERAKTCVACVLQLHDDVCDIQHTYTHPPE